MLMFSKDTLYRFQPQPDITAYELALLLMNLHDNVFVTEAEIGRETLVREPRLVGGPILARGQSISPYPELHRHFEVFVEPVEQHMIVAHTPKRKRWWWLFE